MSSQRSVDWHDLFPFDPYKSQEQGIEEAVDVLSNRGFYVLEGACGTGKTLISLTAALSLIRDPSTRFQRAFVITSRKQQIRAFEDDLQQINDNLTGEEYSGLTLVGKPDLCPYVSAGDIGAREIYHECLSLRDNTQELITDHLKQQFVDSADEAAGNLASSAEVNPRDTTAPSGFTVGGAQSPYRREIPSENYTEYCPFYARHLELRKADDHVLSPISVQTVDDVFEASVAAGSCPHAEMKQLHADIDVLIGNYKHVFDPTTVEAFTAEVIGDETLLICDEAHGIVPEVRTQLSYDTAFRTFQRSIDELQTVTDWIQNPHQYPERERIAEEVLEMCEVEHNELIGAREFLADLQEVVAKLIKHHLQTEVGPRWSEQPAQMDRDPRFISLQDPEEPETDSLQLWAENNDRADEWERTITIGKVVGAVLRAVEQQVENSSPNGDYSVEELGTLLERWFYGSHTEYFREIKLHPQEPSSSPTRPWRKGYYATLHVQNCIPQDEIATTLCEFGGGILMSATLSPLDVFNEVSGVSKVKAGDQPEYGLVSRAIEKSGMRDSPDTGEARGDDEGGQDSTGEEEYTPTVTTPYSEQSRTVKTSSFGLSFPAGNRASFAVEVPKFTYGNRWPPDQNQQLRSTYATALAVVASTTPGNVLICMPSYAEAEWATDVLEQNPTVQKPVLTDESSSDATTERLKDTFFEGAGKILTTSLRGTLTEGVDFEGERLKAVAVCGVPITNTSSDLSTAIRTAYDVRFGRNNGFEYAFSVPAVQKARQAIGRVIRGSNDVGARILLDERYAQAQGFGSVRPLFPESERAEFSSIEPGDLQRELQRFWQSVPHS